MSAAARISQRFVTTPDLLTGGGEDGMGMRWFWGREMLICTGCLEETIT